MEVRPRTAGLSQQYRTPEQEAQDRIQRAEKSVKEAEESAYQKSEEVKDRYDRQRETELTKREADTETERTEGYERMLDLRRKNQAELSRMQRAGEKAKEELTRHYGDELDRIEYSGKKTEREALTQAARSLELRERESQFNTTIAQNEQRGTVLARTQEYNDQLASLEGGYRKDTEERRNLYQTEFERENQAFKDKFGELSQQNQDLLRKIREDGFGRLEDLKEDTSRNLAAYSKRGQDPFYEMVRLGAQLQETDDAYVLHVQIPQHEQDMVSVQLRGKEVVLVGRRRNEESQAYPDGRSVSTSSYQSYTESFPIPMPVEARLLKKEFMGDELRVTLPKTHRLADYQPHRAPTPDRLVSQRPKFPSNLPKVAEEEPKIAENSSPGKRTMAPTRSS